MALFIGIIGLPNIGKSTLFNALTMAEAEAANYAFCTVEPNVGVVDVPDTRLERLAEMLGPQSVTPTAIRFVDIAGLVRGASKGEGLGNQFLGHIRQADALIHLVRCFAEEDVVHVDGEVDPIRDIATIETELLLADLEVVERALPTLAKVVQSEPRSLRRAELAGLQKLEQALSRGTKASEAGLTQPEMDGVRDYRFLTLKPVLYVANVEDAAQNDAVFSDLEGRLGPGKVLPVAARYEAELSELEPEERAEFLAEMGWAAGSLARLIQASYQLLGLITFYTYANGKLEAWQLRGGTLVPQAAGRIHSDMEDGFIRAEVVEAETLLAAGGWGALRENGQLRTEGKDYVVGDGDVVQILFKKG